MRKTLGVALVLLATAGCGGPAFMGTFSGPSQLTGSCSDGSTVPPSSGTFNLVLTENGDTATWMAACGATATAHINGNVASVNQFTCPPTMNNGVTSTLTITGGTLTLNGNSLGVNLIGTITLSGSVTATCSVSNTGTLARQN